MSSFIFTLGQKPLLNECQKASGSLSIDLLVWLSVERSFFFESSLTGLIKRLFLEGVKRLHKSDSDTPEKPENKRARKGKEFTV